MLKRVATSLMLLGGLLVLAGCNTVAGMGQDISNSAHAVQHAL
jgi:predicted small secreted protein